MVDTIHSASLTMQQAQQHGQADGTHGRSHVSVDAGAEEWEADNCSGCLLFYFDGAGPNIYTSDTAAPSMMCDVEDATSFTMVSRCAQATPVIGMRMAALPRTRMHAHDDQMACTHERTRSSCGKHVRVCVKVWSLGCRLMQGIASVLGVTAVSSQQSGSILESIRAKTEGLAATLRWACSAHVPTL